MVPSRLQLPSSATDQIHSSSPSELVGVDGPLVAGPAMGAEGQPDLGVAVNVNDETRADAHDGTDRCVRLTEVTSIFRTQRVEPAALLGQEKARPLAPRWALPERSFGRVSS